MNHFTLLHALIGGILIGLASLIATVLSGRVPGISGVFGRLFVPATADKTWRVVFLIGLVGGAALSFSIWDSAALFRPMRPLAVMAVAGLLVGFDTRLGGVAPAVTACAASEWARRIQSRRRLSLSRSR
jgi:hypothetical protein